MAHCLSLRPSLLFWDAHLLAYPLRTDRAHALFDKVRAERERLKGFDPTISERLRLEFGAGKK